MSQVDAKTTGSVLPANEEFAAYSEYNKTLRAWFVAFGIGGPALFLTNADLAKQLGQSGSLKSVSALFLLGVGSQVIGAWINKAANWYVYYGATNDLFRKKWRYTAALWLLRQFWIDLALDITTMACFGYAAWVVFNAIR